LGRCNRPFRGAGVSDVSDQQTAFYAFCIQHVRHALASIAISLNQNNACALSAKSHRDAETHWPATVCDYCDLVAESPHVSLKENPVITPLLYGDPCRYVYSLRERLKTTEP
jgi:hypothetical protein